MLAAAALVVAGAPLLPALSQPAGASQEPVTERVSVRSDGTQGNGNSGMQSGLAPSLSANGRYVAFQASASNLVDGDGNGKSDDFVRDRQSGTTERVSVSSSGVEGNGHSYRPSLSDDGRYVVFYSKASNLVNDDTNAVSDVFVRDRQAGTTERVSVGAANTQANGASYEASISEDGRYVAFSSSATNLVVGDTNATYDVFLRDRVAGTTKRISLNPTGNQIGANSGNPSITPDGRYVAFGSTYSLYAYDRVTDATELASVWTNGTSISGVNDYPDITPDGRYVAFHRSEGSTWHVVLRDRVAHTTEQLGGSSSIEIPSLSDNGRYVTFSTYASMLSGDTNPAYDVYVYDRVEGTTQWVSTSVTGGSGDGEAYGAAISGDGLVIAFESDSSNLVSGDSNNAYDIFVRIIPPPWIVRPSQELWGKPNSAGFASDPVNTATGNFVQSDVDLEFPVYGLDWSRTYNSLNTAAGPLGVGWSSGFGATVSEGASGDVTFINTDGRRATFTAVSGGWTRPEGVFADLYRGLDGTLSLRWFTGEEWDFDSSGRLEAKSNWDSQTVTFTYGTASRLTSATSSTGYTLTFSYNANNRISAVQASDGRVVSYTYGGNGGMGTVTDPAGGVTNYGTDNLGRVTGISDADGKPVITNTYDSHGRVATQTTPSGDTITFSYDNSTGSTTVTHAGKNSATVYTHDHLGRLTSITDSYGEVLTKDYDSTGNLTSVVDRRGAGTSQTFDGHGNLLTRTSPGGVDEAFAYDSADRLVSYTNGEDETITFTYEGTERRPTTITDPTSAVTAFDVGADGLVSAATDADGVTLTYGYDAKRNLTSVTDEANKTTTLTYDAAGNVASISTPLGQTTASTWDGKRRPLTLTDPAGKVRSQTWTLGGRLASRTDETNKTTAFAYDSAGRLASSTDPLTHATTYGYDPDGNLTSVTRPGNSVWSATYDKLGRRLSETDPTGVTTTYAYDADGNRTASTDENHHTTSWAYDLRGRVTGLTDPLGQTTSFTYDHADRPLTKTDPAGTTTWAYDNAGRLTTESDARGEDWTWTYTAAGRTATSTDPNLHTTTRAHDALGRLDTVTDPAGGVTGYDFDADGRLVSVTSPAGLTTGYAYDTAGRLSTVTDPAGVSETRSYTARGEVAAVADDTGDAQHFVYDAAGRVTQATDRNGGITTFGYDPRGNLLTRTDPKGGVEHWTWDLADRLLTRTDQLNRTTTMTYDNLGRLATVADPSARSVTLAYDNASRLTSRTFGDASTVTYGYDTTGRRTSMVDPTGTTTYGYDPVGHLTSVATPDGKTLTSAYDPAGRRNTLTYPDGQAATYSYDDANHLVGVTHPEGAATTYTRDADGRPLTETIGGGPSRTWSYTSGRPITYSETNDSVTKTTGFAYNADGRLATETTGAGTTTYTYDPAGQLTGVTRPGLIADTTYAYDPAGNRTQEITGASVAAYQYDAAHQLTTTAGVGLNSPGVTTFAYDGAGRLTQANGTTTTRTIGYDARGLATTMATNRLGLGTWTTTRTYDGNGTLRRASTTNPANATTASGFTWDLVSGVPQIATQTTGTNEVDFLYGDERIAALRGGQADLFNYDAHGSALTTGEAADLATASAYDPYGRADNALPDPGVLGLTSDPAADHTPHFGYHGELQLDGLVHLRARDYASSVGRFTTVDPLEGTAGQPTVANPYPYAANDPLGYIDPLGLSPATNASLQCRAGTMPTSVTPTIRGGYQGEQPSGCLGPIGAATGFGGLLMGVSDSLTGGLLGLGGFIINPGQLVPSLQQAYNEAGGGWGGFYYAANQLNPMYGVLTSADACVSAMDAGSAYGAGKDCTTFLTDSAAAAGVVAAGGKLAGLATETGIGSDLAVAQGHLASIDAIDSYLPNKAMLERIADAQATGRALTAAEQNFLTHEVTEAQLMSQGMTLEEAHAAAMQTHPTFANYDPEVITAYPEYFNDNWRAYWGIK